MGTLEGTRGTEQELTSRDCPSSSGQVLKGPLSPHKIVLCLKVENQHSALAARAPC